MFQPTLARMARRGWPEIKARFPQHSYYKNAQHGDALLRARREYILPNAVSGVCIVAFTIAVFAYTIHAVGQDEFSDVPIPDGPAPSAGAPHTSVNTSAGPAPTGS